MRRQVFSTWNVSSIMLAALAVGLSVGLPLGYIAHQLYAGTLDSNFAFLQGSPEVESPRDLSGG